MIKHITIVCTQCKQERKYIAHNGFIHIHPCEYCLAKARDEAKVKGYNECVENVKLAMIKQLTK